MDQCDSVITHGGTGVIIGAVKKGKKVGTLKVTYQDELLYENTFLASRQIEKDTVQLITEDVIVDSKVY